ncbi:MAG: hypothetical protein GX208_09625 [Firmicutes bacterium]|nr:hypothetical protein [Bacillota bacterium]
MKKTALVLLVLLFLISGHSLAENVNQPLGWVEHDLKSDPNSFEVLMNKVAASLGDVKDFSADVKIELVENTRSNITTLNVKASQVHEIARLEFKEPAVLAGQIIIANNQTKEVSVYMPVIQQILVSPIETVGSDLGLGIDFTDLNSLFDFSGFSGEIEEVAETESGLIYRIKLTIDRYQSQYVWIGEDYIPFKVTIYNGDSYLGSLELIDLIINQQLTVEDLQSLPKVKEVRVQEGY